MKTQTTLTTTWKIRVGTMSLVLYDPSDVAQAAERYGKQGYPKMEITEHRTCLGMPGLVFVGDTVTLTLARGDDGKIEIGGDPDRPLPPVPQYYKRTGPNTYEPYSNTEEERDQLLGTSATDAWCPECDCVVTVQFLKFADGPAPACGWCHAPLPEKLCGVCKHPAHDGRICEVVDRDGDPCCCIR